MSESELREEKDFFFLLLFMTKSNLLSWDTVKTTIVMNRNIYKEKLKEKNK